MSAGRTIDLNFDGGEGFDDEAIAPFVTTIHIACGGHAGNSESMKRALDLAARHRLAAGAHPSYPDRAGFGRRPQPLTPAEIEDAVAAQLYPLLEIASQLGVKIAQVKPHGALYHRLSSDPDAAGAFVETIRSLAPELIVIGTHGSHLLQAASSSALEIASEGFADRRYRSDGALLPRTVEGAMLDEPGAAAEQAFRIAQERRAEAEDGSWVTVVADTLCLHGDRDGAERRAEAVRGRLTRAGIRVAALSSFEPIS